MFCDSLCFSLSSMAEKKSTRDMHDERKSNSPFHVQPLSKYSSRSPLMMRPPVASEMKNDNSVSHAASNVPSSSSSAVFLRVPITHTPAVQFTMSSSQEQQQRNNYSPTSGCVSLTTTTTRLQRWSSIGVDVHSLLPVISVKDSSCPTVIASSLNSCLPHNNISVSGQVPAEKTASSSPSSSTDHSSNNGPAQTSSLNAQLHQLSRAAQEAKQEQAFKSAAKKQDGGGGGNAWSRFQNRKRQRDGKDEADRSTTKDTDGGGINNNNSCDEENIDSKNATDKKKSRDEKAVKTKSSKKTTTTTSQRQSLSAAGGNGRGDDTAGAVAPHHVNPAKGAQRNLFSLVHGGRAQQEDHDKGGEGSACSSHSSVAAAAPLITYEIVSDDDVTTLLDSIEQQVNDSMRIQAPLIALAIFTAQHQSNFSLSCAVAVGGGGFTSVSTEAAVHNVAQRQKLATSLTQYLFVEWEGHVYVIPWPVGVSFVQTIRRKYPHAVDIVTFDASWFIHAWLATHNEPKFRCGDVGRECSLDTISDVRVMAWMLDPSSSSCFDFDLVYRQYHTMKNAMASEGGGGSSGSNVLGNEALRTSAFPMNTLQGTADRLHQTVSCYRRLYATMGTRGLLQPFLRQERATTFLCSQMKFDGFLVDISLVKSFKDEAAAALETLKRSAIALVTPHGMSEFNLQSPDDCRHALFDLLALDRFLADNNTATTNKTGRLSTSEDVLKQLAEHHPLPSIIIRYRKLAKLVQTYVDGILEKAEPLDETFATELRGGGSHINGKQNDAKSAGVPTRNRVEGDKTPEAEDDETDVDPFRTPPLPANHRQEEDIASNDAFHGVPVEEYLLHAPTYDRLWREQKDWTTNLRRVHATFFQEGTDTGRLSCFDPNLQNLPRCDTTDSIPLTTTTVNNETDVKNSNNNNNCGDFLLNSSFVRRCFVSLPGCVLVACDYEQIELRVLAHLSADAVLVNTLCAEGLDSDIHRRIAAVIFRRANAIDVTKQERSMAKRVVFGVLYGMGPRALAVQIGESVDRAAQIQQQFRQSFPQLERFHSRIITQCRQDGFVRTIAGRVRYLADIRSDNTTLRSSAERQAFNTVIQGSAADVVKRAMIAVHQDVLQNDAFGGRIRMHCQIHDELVFSVPTEMLTLAVPQIVKAMSSCMLLTVPLRVAVQVGESFGSMKPFDL